MIPKVQPPEAHNDGHAQPRSLYSARSVWLLVRPNESRQLQLRQFLRVDGAPRIQEWRCFVQGLEQQSPDEHELECLDQ